MRHCSSWRLCAGTGTDSQNAALICRAWHAKPHVQHLPLVIDAACSSALISRGTEVYCLIVLQTDPTCTSVYRVCLAVPADNVLLINLLRDEMSSWFNATLAAVIEVARPEGPGATLSPRIIDLDDLQKRQEITWLGVENYVVAVDR